MMFNFNTIPNWIETHAATVGVLKWIGALGLAWASGLLRLVRNLTRKPKVKISTVASRCLIEEFDEIGVYRNAVRASFLLDIDVVNGGAEEIVVRTFNLQVRRKKGLRRWGPKVSAVSLPNRVRHKMGAGTKFMPNWFAHFPDGIERLTIDGPIGPRRARSGFALFVAFTHGDWNPSVVDECCEIRVEVGLTLGKVTGMARVPVTRRVEFFEEMVPGIREQIGDPTAWNLPLR